MGATPASTIPYRALQATTAPPLITKAKQFSKLTGTTFTEYVSRLGGEKTKNLLLNPNLRIREIAYEVGFQSFTEYRCHLPKAAASATKAVKKAPALAYA